MQLIFLTYFCFLCICYMHIFTVTAIPCDSCGNECASACGTKHFRTCCFNYLRKRSDPNTIKMISNKRLIDFILLQGRALFTHNELLRDHDEQSNDKKDNATHLEINRQPYYG
ncbi:trissin [Teleopsis dalmanni]|uniref:trissin n=1 Tax=Teleopsis dalmanni TaxID=139649 RepID=UPI000D32C9EE|nr:trissin [Teleopsis dalmanni]